ncbi:threonine-phosphate decarboxylase CobD [Herbaspirillum sp. SJZ099]|uniref:threonine-phosphate decarboxylase CobD n=1 Tax=Herbaspirillum sp. SJZ099 TaxID=2572916 RepID=UPI00119E99E4|nr:threonine-phosphate decarboxylase CobD [Herbaspirillum sp. SJZ099]TWC71832.1 L-threonine O-3-phosphate decarboxylase [Herbaspirillum sp. SJZ099]
MLEHGGNLSEAMARYGRAPGAWLDLSTGINPVPYPAPALAANAWHRLPEPSVELAQAACAYYGAPHMLPVAGTQAAIQALPQLRLQRDGRPARVLVAAPIYAEHAHCWTRAGHAVREVPYAQLAAEVDAGNCKVLVLCNPNNPTGALVEPAQLLRWAETMAARGGWLVVDEAFGDTMRERSVAAHAGQRGLVVLRSVGKFFGLAGLRLGFVAAEPALLDELADWLGPWSVSGPAQQIGTAALRDLAWQRATLRRLLAEGERLRDLLARHGIASSGSALYQWWPWPQAQARQFHAAMAQQGIWVRLFTGGAGGIRIGLPPDEAGWQRLQQALGQALEQALEKTLEKTLLQWSADGR